MDYNYHRTVPKKCNITIEGHEDDEFYCFDLVFHFISMENKVGNNSLFVLCEENCTKSNGEPAEIIIKMLTWDLKIDHSSEKPFQRSDQIVGTGMLFKLKNNTIYDITYKFNPIMYNSSEILNTKTKNYIETYWTSADNYIYEDSFPFIRYTMQISDECDIYIREYRTLLDTLSKIGGLT